MRLGARRMFSIAIIIVNWIIFGLVSYGIIGWAREYDQKEDQDPLPFDKLFRLLAYPFVTLIIAGLVFLTVVILV